MGITTIGKYMASQTLELRSQTALISFYSLLWDGSFLMVAWDTLCDGIVDCYGDGAANLDIEDIDVLNELISHQHSKYLEDDNE